MSGDLHETPGARGSREPATDSVDPLLLDSGALKRRVLLSGLLTLVSWFVASYLLFAAGLPGWTMIGALVLLWALLVRPLMAPVRASVRMQRQLAYQAFLLQKEQERG